MSILKNWRLDKIRNILKSVTSLKCTPEQLALSSALGVFIGISPYIGLHTYLVILLSGILKLPIYPMLIFSNISNPLTIPIIFTFTTKFGQLILHENTQVSFHWSTINIKDLFDKGRQLLLPFIIGTHIIGLLSAILSYFIVYFTAIFFKNRKNKTK